MDRWKVVGGKSHIRALSSMESKIEKAAVENSKYKWAWIFFVYVVPYGLLAAIALFWPAHSGPFGIDFRNSPLATWAPSISAFVDKSSFPHATAAYYVVSAFVFLPFFVGGLIYPLGFLYAGSTAALEEGRRAYLAAEPWRRVFVFPFFAVIVFTYWYQPGYQFGLLPVLDERWALALGGPITSLYFVLYFVFSSLVITFKFRLQQSRNWRNDYGTE